jgi:hypothetical protein
MRVNDAVSIELEAGDHVTCTFINAFEAELEEEVGQIIVAKVTDEDPSASVFTEFGFRLMGDDVDEQFGLITITAFEDVREGVFVSGPIEAGEFTLTETQEDGFTLEAVICALAPPEIFDPEADIDELEFVEIDPPVVITDEAGTVTLDLEGGQIIVCVFINLQEDVERVPGAITIVKAVVGDTGTPFGFTTTGGGGLPAEFTLAGGTQVTHAVEPGTYTVTEATVSGWRLASITCTAGGTVNFEARMATIEVDDDTHVTCVFLNIQLEVGVLPGVTPPVIPDAAASVPTPSLLPILMALGLLGSVGALATANVAARRRQ